MYHINICQLKMLEVIRIEDILYIKKYFQKMVHFNKSVCEIFFFYNIILVLYGKNQGLFILQVCSKLQKDFNKKV